MAHRSGIDEPTEFLSYRGKAVSTTIPNNNSQYLMRDNSCIEGIFRERNYLRLIAADVFKSLSYTGSYIISMRAEKYSFYNDSHSFRTSCAVIRPSVSP